MKTLAAITTPFGTGGDVDLDAFEAHVRWLEEGGLDGVFVAGTTGEGVLLENDEVEALTRQAASAAGTLRVIAQVGLETENEAEQARSTAEMLDRAADKRGR